MDPAADRVERLLHDLLVEMTAQRLVTRSIVTTMIASSALPVDAVLRTIEDSAAMTSPDFFPLAGVDPALQAKASELAKARARTVVAAFWTPTLDHAASDTAPPTAAR